MKKRKSLKQERNMFKRETDLQEERAIKDAVGREQKI